MSKNKFERSCEILDPPLFSLLQFECAAGVTYVLPLQAANFALSHIYFVAENWPCFMKLHGYYYVYCKSSFYSWYGIQIADR